MQEDFEDLPEVPEVPASEERDPNAWADEGQDTEIVTEWDASMDMLTPDDFLDDDDFEEGEA